MCAPLNNPDDLLNLYTALFGRSAGVWHGDTSPGERRRLLAEPPDLLSPHRGP